jgi:hypothetical protein
MNYKIGDVLILKNKWKKSHPARLKNFYQCTVKEIRISSVNSDFYDIIVNLDDGVDDLFPGEVADKFFDIKIKEFESSESYLDLIEKINEKDSLYRDEEQLSSTQSV